VKGIVLAGGTGSRLGFLTRVANKHALPVGSIPMIFHAMRKLADAGIREVCVVTGTEHVGDMIRLLGSGRDFGIDLTYRVQDEAGGIAQAIALCESFVGASQFVVLLGDNIFEEPIRPFLDGFLAQPPGSIRLWLKAVHDPQRYGVADVDGDMIVGIVEKPQAPKSRLAVTGIYAYAPEVFAEIFSLTPSARGELEVTDLNNLYVRGGLCRFSIMQGWWTDAGTPESYALANRLAAGLP
jgi:glucose-1-phosphate thymidylyltransferase